MMKTHPLGALIIILGLIAVSNSAPYDASVGDLNLLVLGTKDLVGYNASLPYIRWGDIQWKAIQHVFTVDNEVDHFQFLMQVRQSILVYNISVEVNPAADGVIDPKIYFVGETEPTSINGNAIAIKGNLGVQNKTKKVDIVALCDPKKQKSSNVTLGVRMKFTFQVIGGSAASAPVAIEVNRNKKCFLTGQDDPHRPWYSENVTSSRLNSDDARWNLFENNSSSSIFFVSIGISLGVIFIICLVVAFYHFTTFRPQQRKNLREYTELPFPDATAQGHVPMFMPKGFSPGHSTYPAGLNPQNFPGSNTSECTSPFLNQSKISDGSGLSHSKHGDQYYAHDPKQTYPTVGANMGASYNCQREQVQTCCYNQKKPGQQSRNSPPFQGSEPQYDLSGNSATSGLDLAGEPSPNLNFSDIEVAKELITFTEILQEGTFGRLCRGFVTIPRDPNASSDQQAEKEVFIKTVAANSSSVQIEVMLREGAKFRHVNNKYILSVAGVVSPNYLTTNCVLAPPMLLYPFTANGNLKLFLKQLRENHQPLTTKEVVGMALHIAKAIQYLDKKKMVVGDLATRNCVVDDRLGVKITDSALARDIFPNDYHCLGDGLNRPVKWLSPESLAFYSTEAPGDVWSFGVTFWELLTFAQQPFQETDPFEMLTYLKSNNRLYQPLNCPDELYRVMESCWSFDSEERPKINKLISYLTDFNKTLGAYI